MTRSANRPEIAIIVGQDWKAQQPLLTEFRRAQADPLELVVDVVDIVLDGRNITSAIAKDHVVELLHDMLEGALRVVAGRVAKSIVAYHHEPWELVLVPCGQRVLVSLYGIGPHGELVVRNQPVGSVALVREISRAAGALVDELALVADELEQAPRARALTRLVADAHALLRSPRLLAGPAPLTGPTWPDERCESAAHGVGKAPATDTALLATHAGFRLRLLLERDDPDFLAYDGTNPFDQHALLLSGRLLLETADGLVLPLHEGPGLLSTIGQLGAFTHALLTSERPTGAVARLGATMVSASDGALIMRRDGVQREIGPFELAALLDLALEHFSEWAGRANKAQLGNQRLVELRSAARETRALAEDLAHGRAWLADPARLLADYGPVCAETSADVAPARFPHPVAASRLKLLNCERRWTYESTGISYWGVRLLEDTVVIPTEDGVAAVDRRGGEVLWLLDSDGVSDVHPLPLDDPSVLIANGPRLQRVAARSGVVCWDVSLQQPLASWLEQAVHVVRLGDAAVLLLATDAGVIEARSAGEGVLLWRHRLRHGELMGAVAAGPVVVMASSDGLLLAYNTWTGEELWRVPLRGELPAAPQVVGELLVVAREDASSGATTVHGLDLVSGRDVWQRELTSFEATRLVAADGRVVVLGEADGTAQWWALDGPSGAVCWTLRPPFPPGASESALATASGGALFVKDTSDVLCRVELGTGVLAWAQVLPGASAGPVVGELHVARDVLLVTHGTCFVANASTGELLCGVGGIAEEPAMVQLTPEFDLLVGDDGDSALPSVTLYQARHFLAVVV